ncbi:MAG: hypothetical protein NC432_09700 [Roseburia sp.]|nr:hypothetical protein [Roseburia sp.]MCM1096789.1 hypothetical protein [Ruminococcus flavefaciens]
MEDMKALFEKMRARMDLVRSVFGEENLAAVPLFEDCVCYPVDLLVRLAKMAGEIEELGDPEKIRERLPEFKKLRLEIEGKKTERPRIMLWPESKVPTLTDYRDNSAWRYNHNPDFVPYLYEMLVAEEVTPKGAIVLCAGGDHGFPVLCESYQVALDFNKMGYQCFILLNRPNGNPWDSREAGADVARAIRIVRANAAKYRIAENRVAFAGFSNGGLTGEACIQYYSGDQKVADVFAGYEEDALDQISGSMDVFLCIYGPRMNHDSFDYSRVVYPPVFHALGLEDFNMDNINRLYPELVSRGITVELHTFSGVPHGQAGRKLLDGTVKYPNFEVWEMLADQFMQNMYCAEGQKTGIV